MIFCYFKNGLNQAQLLERCTQTFGDLAPSHATVFNWFAEFKRGITSFEIEKRSGRPLMAVTEDKHWCCREDVARGCPCDLYGHWGTPRIGLGSVAKILRVSKVSSCWVPQSHWRSEGHSSGIVAVKCLGDSTMVTLAANLRSLQVTRPGFTSVIQKQSITHRSGCSLMIDLSKWKEQKALGRKWC